MAGRQNLQWADGVVLSVTALPRTQRDLVQQLLKEGGGSYSPNLSKRCTHLAIPSKARPAIDGDPSIVHFASAKLRSAVRNRHKSRLHIVTVDWVLKSAQLKQRADESRFPPSTAVLATTEAELSCHAIHQPAGQLGSWQGSMLSHPASSDAAVRSGAACQQAVAGPRPQQQQQPPLRPANPGWLAQPLQQSGEGLPQQSVESRPLTRFAPPRGGAADKSLQTQSPRVKHSAQGGGWRQLNEGCVSGQRSAAQQSTACRLPTLALPTAALPHKLQAASHAGGSGELGWLQLPMTQAGFMPAEDLLQQLRSSSAGLVTAAAASPSASPVGSNIPHPGQPTLSSHTKGNARYEQAAARPALRITSAHAAREQSGDPAQKQCAQLSAPAGDGCGSAACMTALQRQAPPAAVDIAALVQQLQAPIAGSLQALDQQQQRPKHHPMTRKSLDSLLQQAQAVPLVPGPGTAQPPQHSRGAQPAPADQAAHLQHPHQPVVSSSRTVERCGMDALSTWELLGMLRQLPSEQAGQQPVAPPTGQQEALLDGRPTAGAAQGVRRSGAPVSRGTEELLQLVYQREWVQLPAPGMPAGGLPSIPGLQQPAAAGAESRAAGSSPLASAAMRPASCLWGPPPVEALPCDQPGAQAPLDNGLRSHAAQQKQAQQRGQQCPQEGLHRQMHGILPHAEQAEPCSEPLGSGCFGRSESLAPTAEVTSVAEQASPEPPCQQDAGSQGRRQALNGAQDEQQPAATASTVQDSLQDSGDEGAAQSQVADSGGRVFSGIVALIDGGLSLAEQQRVAMELQRGGGQVAEGSGLSAGVTHVVCQPEAALKWLSMGVGIVSAQWVHQSLRAGRQQRCLSVSADASRHLPLAASSAGSKASTAEMLQRSSHGASSLEAPAGSSPLLAAELLLSRDARLGLLSQLAAAADTAGPGRSAAAGTQQAGSAASLAGSHQQQATPALLLGGVQWSVLEDPLAAKLESAGRHANLGCRSIQDLVIPDSEEENEEEEAALHFLTATQAAVQDVLQDRVTSAGFQPQPAAGMAPAARGRPAWQEAVVLQGPAQLVLLLPRDAWGELGLDTRCLLLPTAADMGGAQEQRQMTAAQLLGTVHAYYQEQIGCEEQLQLLRSFPAASNVATLLRPAFLELAPLQRAALLGARCSFEGLRKVTREPAGAVYEVQLDC